MVVTSEALSYLVVSVFIVQWVFCHYLFFSVYLQVYVKVNQEAKTDEDIFEAGKVYFSRMEQGY